MAHAFVDTSTNMVQVVRNAIETYSMGPLRALAQEPVQNSKDAKVASKVIVEYRLMPLHTANGRSQHHLAVTDYGTSGLIGPILNKDERDRQGLVLNAGENWAAFEGQGFTVKEQGDALGSRGQGKSAFLYHSRPVNRYGDPLEQYLILYDTLLSDNNYRLGVRRATPADRVMEPPLAGEDARLTITGDYEVDDEIVVPLRLKPLNDVGTRVIVPFVSEEVQEAIRNKELHRWLQRCWWRAIQIGDLEVKVIDGHGNAELVNVPEWWRDEPWKDRDGEVTLREDIVVGDDLKIKRIVLLYDDALDRDEIDGYGSQFEGIQLLRGQQWIETLDIRDWIPPEFRAGFRGFAEFDIALEKVLKDAENPQHENFDGRKSWVALVKQRIGEIVNEYAEKNGWLSPSQVIEAPRIEQRIATEFLRVFASVSRTPKPGGGSGNNHLDENSDLSWGCELKLDYPDPASAKVDWGQHVRNLTVNIECDPPSISRSVDVWLELVGPDEVDSTPVAQRTGVGVREGSGVVSFGDYQFIQGQAGPNRIQASQTGEYKLRAIVNHAGNEVAVASRHVFVNVDPPEPAETKPHTIYASVKNLSKPGQRRIDDGDEISIQITVTNRSPSDANLRLNASLGDLGEMLADDQSVKVAGTPAGDVIERQSPVFETRRVHTSSRLTDEPHFVLPPGRHYLRADLFVAGEHVPVAYHNQPVYVEVEPAGNRDDLPFVLEAVKSDVPAAMWHLVERQEDDWVLRYPDRYPLYANLPQLQRRSSKLSGRTAFIAEICANGLIEWALLPLENFDGSRLEQLRSNRPDEFDQRRWETYSGRLDLLESAFENERLENVPQFMQRWRDAVAHMLDIFEDLS